MPASALSPQAAHVPYHAVSTSGALGPPPTFGIVSMLAGGFAVNARAQKRVTLAVGLLVIALLAAPDHQKLSGGLGDFHFEATIPTRDLIVFVASVVLARLAALMADGARLAAVLKAKFDYAVSTDEKTIASLTVGDADSEQEIFAEATGLQKLVYAAYWVSRVLQGLAYYLLALSLVAGLAVLVGMGIDRMWRTPTLTAPLWQIVLCVTIFFCAQAFLSLSQYWLIRRVA